MLMCRFQILVISPYIFATPLDSLLRYAKLKVSPNEYFCNTCWLSWLSAALTMCQNVSYVIHFQRCWLCGVTFEPKIPGEITSVYKRQRGAGMNMAGRMHRASINNVNTLDLIGKLKWRAFVLPTCFWTLIGTQS